MEICRSFQIVLFHLLLARARQTPLQVSPENSFLPRIMSFFVLFFLLFSSLLLAQPAYCILSWGTTPFLQMVPILSSLPHRIQSDLQPALRTFSSLCISTCSSSAYSFLSLSCLSCFVAMGVDKCLWVTLTSTNYAVLDLGIHATHLLQILLKCHSSLLSHQTSAL